MKLNARILVVDDEPMLRRLMRDRMQYWGCRIEEAARVSTWSSWT